MRLWNILSCVSWRRRAILEWPCALAIERLESPRGGSSVPRVLAVAETMEPRVLLSSTFDCYMSAQPNGSHLNKYQVIAWTTGGQASQYVVHYNDPNSGGSSSITYTAPANGAPLKVNYQYKGPYTGTITVTATSTTNVNATAHFALDSSFGNFQGLQGTGASAVTPNGNAAGVGQTSAALDDTGDALNGDLFVAHSYFPTTGSTSLMAVTAFTANGQVDGKWGTINGVANNGTFVFSSFSGGSDVPYSIAIGTGSDGGNYIVVAGKSADGWAIAAVNTEQISGTNTYGVFAWHSVDNFETGQANAVVVDASDYTAVVVGTDGTHMVAADLNLSGGSAAWDNGGLLTISRPSGATSSGAYAVVDEDEIGGQYNSLDHILVAGYCEFSDREDFCIVPIGDNSTTPSVGTTTVLNIGSTLQAAGDCCVTSSPSNDSVYSLVMWEDANGNFYADVVGRTTAFSSTTLAVAQYTVDISTGNLDGLVSSYGIYTTGIAIGPTDNAQGATLVSTSSGAIAVAGTSGGDIITVQFTGSGALDTTFGSSGVMYQDFGNQSSNSTDQGNSVLLAADGSLIVVGNTTPSGASYSQIALVDILDSNKVNIT